jgi:SAM-dependent methyltransferase
MNEAYREQIAAERQKWANEMKVEAARKVEATAEWYAWLDQPLINAHYRERSLIGGLPWERWVAKYFGRPAERSLDLGCGTGSRSFNFYEKGGTAAVDGVDVTEERIAEAERLRSNGKIRGHFWAEDVNRVRLPPSTYDAIFSVQSFHHFVELEHVMNQAHQALTERGLFILEEFVGPTQFQWTKTQMLITRALMFMIPSDLRMLRWGVRKNSEGRPTVEELVASSPFESIRSAEIVPLFRKYFDMVTIRKLGGTIQHLLYNGIAHNFRPNDVRAKRLIRAIYTCEDALIDTGVLPSDFMLLIGRRRGPRSSIV